MQRGGCYEKKVFGDSDRKSVWADFCGNNRDLRMAHHRVVCTKMCVVYSVSVFDVKCKGV